MITLPAVITSIINDVKGRPTEIHDIYLGSQVAEDSNTLHFATYYKTINFFQYISGVAESYIPLGITRSAIKKGSQGEIDRISYKLDNVNRGMGAYAATKDFRNKRIVTRLVFRDVLNSSANCKVSFDGIIQAIQFGKSSMTATCVPIISSLTFQSGWSYQINCNAKFGDVFCGINKNSLDNKVTGTATGGSTTTLIDTVNLTQADDYWNIGIIYFDSGANSGSFRKVADFVASQDKIIFDYPLASAIAAGDTYRVFRGCDKRLVTCDTTYNNTINYRGFHTIPLTK